MYRKLGASSRSEAVERAAELGLVDRAAVPAARDFMRSGVTPVPPLRPWNRRAMPAEDFERILRKLALQDERYIESVLACDAANLTASTMDARTHAFVRLGALIATGGTAPSYMSTIEPALAAGATADEVVGALVAVLPQVGTTRVVSATRDLALALGYDVSRAALELSPTSTPTELVRDGRRRSRARAPAAAYPPATTPARGRARAAPRSRRTPPPPRSRAASGRGRRPAGTPS